MATPARPTRELPTRVGLLIGLSIVCFAFAIVLAILIGTHNVSIQDSDYSIGTWINSQVRTGGVELLGHLSLFWHYVVGPIGSTIMAIGALAVLVVTKHRGWALYLAACAVGGVVIAEALKHLVARPRPDYMGYLVTDSGGSFPSGHTMAGIYVWVVVGVIVLYLVPGSTGTICGSILIVLGVLAGPSRLILGVHYASDVVAGWMLALGWVLLVSAVGIMLARKRSDRPPVGASRRLPDNTRNVV